MTGHEQVTPISLFTPAVFNAMSIRRERGQV